MTAVIAVFCMAACSHDDDAPSEKGGNTKYYYGGYEILKLSPKVSMSTCQLFPADLCSEEWVNNRIQELGKSSVKKLRDQLIKEKDWGPYTTIVTLSHSSDSASYNDKTIFDRNWPKPTVDSIQSAYQCTYIAPYLVSVSAITINDMDENHHAGDDITDILSVIFLSSKEYYMYLSGYPLDYFENEYNWPDMPVFGFQDVEGLMKENPDYFAIGDNHRNRMFGIKCAEQKRVLAADITQENPLAFINPNIAFAIRPSKCQDGIYPIQIKLAFSDGQEVDFVIEHRYENVIIPQWYLDLDLD